MLTESQVSLGLSLLCRERVNAQAKITVMVTDNKFMASKQDSKAVSIKNKQNWYWLSD